MTDQCPAMKKAIPLVFPESKHRFCLWHITNKLDTKIVFATSYVWFNFISAVIGKHLRHSTNFISEIKKLVWSVNLDPSEFESRWKDMMEEFGLVGDSWFKLMFKIRKSWIPAYM
ncbi:LOW QUALITY PROTEIN: hypothetical protein OSB04_031380, partial [Centaurea solstitialis]